MEVKEHNWFGNRKPLKVGIWGCRRGSCFIEICKMLGIEIVAGCDYYECVRKTIQEMSPGIFVTDNVDEFLAQDFDAVILATFFMNHAADALRCLRAGKHVLSECSAFFTPAEGVALVDEVEKSGLTYNLAENYPSTPANRYLAAKWQTGVFGELSYGEAEYVHECRKLQYEPVLPGHFVHQWRSWLNMHYYCTHSLGPLMRITRTRPVRVSALPDTVGIAGYVKKQQVICSSLVSMDNGSLVRNLIGATTNDTPHVLRLWGTRGAVESNSENTVLRLGAAGLGVKMKVNHHLTDELTLMAEKTGHGGGDFWPLYEFAREILTGEPAFFNVYRAADMTLTGIFAYKSSLENGTPQEIPDFRIAAVRDAFRNDHFRQKEYDSVNAVFPAGADAELTGKFPAAMTSLIDWVVSYRAYVDWKKFEADAEKPDELAKMREKLVNRYDEMRSAYRLGRKIADAYPVSDAARVINEMLELGDEQIVLADDFLEKLKR